LPVPVVPGDPIPGMHAETAVMPGHEFFDELIAYSAFSLEHGQDSRAENLFQFFKLGLGEAIEGPVRSKQSIGHDGMKMGMKPGIIPKGVNHHDHAEDAVIETQQRAEEHPQASTRLRGHRLWRRWGIRMPGGADEGVAGDGGKVEG